MGEGSGQSVSLEGTPKETPVLFTPCVSRDVHAPVQLRRGGLSLFLSLQAVTVSVSLCTAPCCHAFLGPWSMAMVAWRTVPTVANTRRPYSVIAWPPRAADSAETCRAPKIIAAPWSDMHRTDMKKPSGGGGGSTVFRVPLRHRWWATSQFPSVPIDSFSQLINHLATTTRM